MPFKLEILWTDALVWVLVGVSAVFGWYVRRQPHLRAPWKRVARSGIGMSALVVLSLFVITGLLDSIHFRSAVSSRAGEAVYGVEVKSVLDVLIGGLKARPEKTYSAPLATHLFAKETITLPGGGEIRDFPRLRFGGARLQDPQKDRAADVAFRAAAGAAAALALWLALVVVVCASLARRHTGLRRAASEIAAGRTEVPWRAMLLTLLAFLLAAGPIAALAAEYHVFGTDKVGQDVLYQALKSVRTALLIGTLTTLVMLPFALLFGIMAGYLRGWVDDVVQYVYTTLSSIPGVLLIVAAVLTMQV
jgi:peptide/nickel transport system permease protein